MAGSGPSTFPSGARPPQPVVSDAAASAAAVAAMSSAAAAAGGAAAAAAAAGGGAAGTAVAPAVQPRRPTAEERRRRRETLIRDFFSPPLVYNRYRVEKVVGEGAYGVVCAATDTSTGRQVAVKRIRRVLDSAAMATRVLRELKFGRVLSAHENVISVLDVLVPGDRDRFNDVFVVFELMPTDLSRLLRSKTVLHEQHLQFFMFQLLRGLHFVHAANVMHRDLNPNNILVNNDCQLRICDFGLARAAFQEQDNLFWTDYVATRWYRAPELIMSAPSRYSQAIDMWSVGCIFAEMLGRGRPLFPGSNAYEQFALIISVTGRPSAEVLDVLGNARVKDFLDALPQQPQRRTPIASLFPNASPGAVALLERLLEFNPTKRPTALQALGDPYFADFRDRLGLGADGTPLDPAEFAFERGAMTSAGMRTEFLREVAVYHPSEAAALLSGGPVRSDAGVGGGGSPGAGVGSGGPGGSGYQVPSASDAFRAAMDSAESGTPARASTTLPQESFERIADGQAPTVRTLEYRSMTMGEAELAQYDRPAREHEGHTGEVADPPTGDDMMDRSSTPRPGPGEGEEELRRRGGGGVPPHERVRLPSMQSGEDGMDTQR